MLLEIRKEYAVLYCLSPEAVDAIGSPADHTTALDCRGPIFPLFGSSTFLCEIRTLRWNGFALAPTVLAMTVEGSVRTPLSEVDFAAFRGW